MVLKVNSLHPREVIDITSKVAGQVSGSGLVNVFIRHTSAALAITDLDPGANTDLLAAIESLTPKNDWQHLHDPNHFPDHFWSMLIGPSLSVPIEEGRLALGKWQRMVLIELNGPKEREVYLTSFITNE